ncbi:MAG: hypothetical protein HZB55_08565 [Deltaproteobacteria bacterium]|nr:hypothetical protein [Deltaproteobacteria bacterium]
MQTPSDCGTRRPDRRPHAGFGGGVLRDRPRRLCARARRPLLLLLPALIFLGAGARAVSSPATAPRWVRISYADLLDPDTTVRTGERLVDAVRRPDRRAAVQPFVDRYSFLLPHALSLLYGPDASPQASVTDPYPAGAAQPAWVAILRAGRLLVTSDGKGRARVFVPGSDPRRAYREHYSVLRHPLARLLPTAGGSLTVDVFAYRNEYSASELLLDPKPYRLRSSRFPAEGVPVNLAALEQFFRQGRPLEGAEVDPTEGLVLYASRGAPQTLGGQPQTLADFVAAYRAAFHAGDNEAFVSLDPERHPASSAVNFGGLLEDTRVGAVALAADKRFKTVCSGLDPDRGTDVRAATRKVIPSFLTNSERTFLGARLSAPEVWISTRYWFYPGSCGVEADASRRLAVVTRPRFTADAERLGEGYPSGRGGAKAALPAEVRDNLRDINRNYGLYAEAFPEIRELAVVARLMAVCSWLRTADRAWLDLDGLLAVELPAVATPRHLPRLLSAESLVVPASGAVDADTVRRDTRVRFLSPELDETVEQVFEDAAGLAAFLERGGGAGPLDPRHREERARELFERDRGAKVRDLLRTEADLRAFLRFTVSRPDQGATADREAETDAARARRLQEELSALAGRRARAEREGDDPGPEERRLRRELQGIMEKYHARSRGGAGSRTYTVTQHTGGVSLDPRLFSVRKNSAGPALERLRRARAGRGEWLRSSPPRPARPGAREPAPSALPTTAPRTSSSRRPSRQPPRVTQPAARALPTSQPRFSAEELPPPVLAPVVAERNVEVRSPVAGGTLLGRLAPDGRIVFRRAGP